MWKTIIAVGMIVGALVVVQDEDPPPPKMLNKTSDTQIKSSVHEKSPSLPNPGLDELLGRGGKARWARRLAETKIDGKTHGWTEYSAWGKELFLTCQVQKPPTGPAPSKPISEHYRCTHCHNNVREDRVLSVQDPNDRVAYLLELGPTDPPVRLHTGTTVWGAVNREAFYNDSYQVYHWLTVGLRPMNPLSLEDATQVCCTYCSVGRLAETWEILSMLTYFWDLELKLSDLDLPEAVARSVVEIMTAPAATRDANAVTQTRKMLMQLYLRRAGAHFTATPKDLKSDKHGPYPDKAQFQGDPKIGQQLYALACDHCHGEGKPNELAGADLARNLRTFHTILAHGTVAKDGPYMPMFPRERLSRQQIADIQAYLKAQ